jgi:cytochrome P450
MDTPHEAIPPRFDVSDPDFQVDPYATYARLRAASAVCRGGPGQWVISRYRDVAALLGDPRLQNQLPAEYYRLTAGNGPTAEFLQRILIYQDRPKHTILRKAIGHCFEPRKLEALRRRIEDLVQQRLAPALERGFLEVVEDLALPLPIMVVCEIIGIPVADYNEIRPKAMELGKAFVLTNEESNRATADAAVSWLRCYIGRLLEQRNRSPTDDLLSRMLVAEGHNEGLSREDLIDNTVFLFFAGFETTTSLISTACATLLESGRELARLQSDLSLIPNAIEEFLRYDAPVQSRFRLVREAIQIDGRTIKPGRLLLLLLGSANHDDAQFVEPEKLNVMRRPNMHVSFGGGNHFCLGAGMARLEALILFENLLRCCKRIEQREKPVRSVGSPFRTYARVPIDVTVG